MKRARAGFTLIEVALFLAVTTALFVGIATGTYNSIFQQRYNDAVQNFTEFMRSVYSQVSNVQNENTGRSGQAIYGKVVTFGVDEEGRNKIKSYNLIGDAVEMTTTINAETDETQTDQDTINTIAECTDTQLSGTVLGKLACLNANVVYKDGETFRTVGFVEDYLPRWDSQIQTTAAWDPNANYGQGGYQPYEGILVVTRGASSGSVYTFVLQNYNGKDDEANRQINEDNQQRVEEIIGRIEQCEGNNECGEAGNPFLTRGTDNKLYHDFRYFEVADIDYCINPSGLERTSLKRDVRIKAGTKNASGVEIMIDDSVERDDGNYDKCQI